MNITSWLVSSWLLAAAPAPTVLALTVEREITPAEVREHPREWAVKVARKGDGLIDFTIVRTLSEPKYLVARLSVRHAGKVIVDSSTPLFAKPSGNTFYFSISAEDIAESTFSLSESGLGTVNGVTADVPVPGSDIHQFRLRSFVPPDLVKPAPNTTQSRLLFRLVTDADDAAPADTLADSGSKEQLRVRREVLLDESAVSSATVAKAPADGGVQIEVVLTEAGAKRFAEITSANIGKRLAMVFDGKLLSAPTIRSVIRDKAVIGGKFTADEAEVIAKALNKLNP
ncbi:MAG: hypothetical protein ABSH20_00410 [Tepidisphaeraceae bacterium]